MIVGERKPLKEIQSLIEGAESVLVVGCGTCVAVCMAGGEKEANILASQLTLASRIEKRNLRIETETIERQCDREFFEPLVRKVEEFDAVVSLACGAGVQLMAERFESIPIFPGLDTRFIGVAEDVGYWTERCRACGQCLLGYTGGICPITRCSKSLLNGPCGGPVGSYCEVDNQRPCAWIQIYERLKAQGRLDLITKVRPAQDHSRFYRPDDVVHPAYLRSEKIG